MTLHKLKINSLIGLFIAALSGSSCTKLHDFGNLNNDPTVATSPVTSALFTNVLSNMAVFTWDAGNITTISGLYSQYFSETQYTDVSIYSKQSQNWDAYFASAIFPAPNVNQYTPTGYLSDLQAIINYNTDPATQVKAAANGSNANQIAIARILKVYIFSTLTDIYGDIPYFKALSGVNSLVPYDKQQDIYTDMFKELTAAVAQFDGGAPISGDILLGGNVAKWKKFANSLHAMLALHLSKVDPATGKKEFAAALAGGVIGEGEDIRLAFPGGNFLSPVYKYYDVTKRFDYAVSKTMTDWLAANSDPRGNPGVYGTSTVGFPFGLSRNDAVAFANNNPTFAQVMRGAAGSKATDSFNVITAGEIYLARAEAAQLGWTGEDPFAMYSLGIKSSWELWNVYDAATFATYMASANISLASGNALQKICTQEWVTHYPAGVRGWVVWRRTGYPALVGGPASIPIDGGIIPRRMAYGPNEYSYNLTNTNTVATQYTVSGDKDSQLARMWWDVQ
jgi:hypothetical protein